MKRYLSLLIFIVIILLVGCSNAYGEKEISVIEYSKVNYNGGFTTTRKVDFNQNKVFVKKYLPGDEQNNFEESYDIDNTLRDDFLKKMNSTGLFKIKNKYKTPYTIMDGSGWTFIITYEDGSVWSSRGDNAGPYTILKKADKVFFDYFGGTLFDSLDSSYTNIPNLDAAIYCENEEIEMYAIKTKSVWLHESSLTSYPISKVVNYQKENFEINKEYTLTIDKNNIQSISIFTFELDGTKGETPERKLTFIDGIAECKIELNNIYILHATYDKGSVDYSFSTKVFDQSILPEIFYFDIIWVDENKNEYGYLLSDDCYWYNHERVYYKLKDEDILAIYQKLYSLNLDKVTDRYYENNDPFNHTNKYLKVNYRYYGVNGSIYFNGIEYKTLYEENDQANQLITVFYEIFDAYLKNSFDEHRALNN